MHTDDAVRRDRPRRSSRWAAWFGSGGPLIGVGAEPHAWAREVHARPAPTRPIPAQRRPSERPEEHLAARPLFGRYPLLAAGRSRRAQVVVVVVGPGAERMPLTALKPTLPGDRVLLRPPTRGDAHAMAAVLADPVVQRALARVASTEEAEAVATSATPELLDWYATRADQPDRLDLVVVDRDTGVVVGEVVLDRWDPDARSAQLQVLLHATVRGRGLGTEAARLVLGHGFDDLALNRVEAVVLADDDLGIRAYASVGFVVEGTRREAFWYDGRPVDQVVMALLRSDWRRHRGRPVLAT